MTVKVEILVDRWRWRGGEVAGKVKIDGIELLLLDKEYIDVKA